MSRTLRVITYSDLARELHVAEAERDDYREQWMKDRRALTQTQAGCRALQDRIDKALAASRTDATGDVRIDAMVNALIGRVQ